jgi:hypothetical protein
MATNEEDILRRIQAGRQADVLRMAASMPRSPEAYRQRARLMALLEPETGAEVAASMAAGTNPLVGLTQDLYDTGAGLATRDPVRTLFGLGGLALTASPFSGRRARQAAEEGLARAQQLDVFESFGQPLRNKPIDDPAVREAVTGRGDEFAAGKLGVEELPKPLTEEQMNRALQSVIRGAPNDEVAFNNAVQRALMNSETASEAAESVRRQFADMSDAEFADRFGSAVDLVIETQRSLESGRGIRSLTGEQKLVQGVFPQQERSMREQGAGLVGTKPVEGRGLYDVETLQAPAIAEADRPLRRIDLLSEPTEVDLAASKIIQRRAGMIDIDEMPALRAGDLTDEFKPVEGLFDPEDVGDLRTYREQLEEVYGDDIPTGLDFNSILNEMQDMPEFQGVPRGELVSAVTNALNAIGSDVAISVGRETLKESGEDAARFLMRGVDIGRRGEISGRRRNILGRKRAEEALRRKERREAIKETVAGPEIMEAIERRRLRDAERLRQEAFERAYSGDPTERFDPLDQYMGAGSRTPKREYRLANPDWRRGLLTIPPNR